MGIRVPALMALLGLAVTSYNAIPQDLAGMNQDEVFALQQRLRDAGCYTGAFDGKVGPALIQAVKACPSQEPVLTIETGMHTARIARISADASCKLLATGSRDKTVRLWSLPDGNLIRTQRLPVGDGDLGKVYAVAMAPDGKRFAAGGWDAIRKTDRRHGVYAIDTATGTQVKHLGAFEDVVLHLVYSPDGKRLAVGLGTTGIRVLDAETGNELMADREFRGSSYGLAFSRAGILYAVGDDGYLRRYGLDLKRSTRVTTPGGNEPVSIAVDPSGERLAIGYFDSPAVDIFDARTLKHIAPADTSGVPNDDSFSSVAWSADGQSLFAAGRFSIRLDNAWKRVARKWTRDGVRDGPDVPLAANTILSMATCPDAIFFGATDPSFGRLGTDGSAQTLGQSRVPDMRAKVGNALLVSADGTRLRFGLGFGAEQPALFDLKSGLVEASQTAPPNLEPPQTVGLPVKNWQNQADPTLDGKPLLLLQHETSRSLAIRPDEKGFVLGAEWSLRSFNADGSERWVQDVPSIAWGVNLVRGGELVVVAYADGTIRWHRWDNGKQILALFVHKEDMRWVAWTPTGYYMASAGAEDLIGWHLNRGWEQPADFFPVARFRERFNRPDIVRLVLETLDEETAIRRANTTSRRADLSKQLIADLPPVIRITNYNEGASYPFASEAFTLEYRLRSPSGRSVDRIDFLIDGKAQQAIALSMTATTTAQERSGKVAVTLPRRDVEVALIAWSGQQASEPTRIKLNWSGQREDVKPTLYALIVGVSNYTEQGLKLNYASKDATDLAAMLMQQKGKTYADIKMQLLIDAESKPVSRENIIDGLQWLEQQKTNSRDLSVIFFAGHGVSDQTGTYYFLPSNVDTQRLRATGVRQEEIESTLRSLKNRVLLFLDTCHSGSAVRLESLRVDINPVVNRFSATETGVIAFASSQGREDSIESADLNNGIFTKALLEGLFDFRADYLKEGSITPGQLYIYMNKRVTDYTGGKQKPVMVRPPTVPEYSIIARN